MKKNNTTSLVMMLLFMILYLNSNIYFMHPIDSYKLHKSKIELDHIIESNIKNPIQYKEILLAKVELILDINNSTKLTKYQKRKIIKAIQNIQVIVADLVSSESETTKITNGLYKLYKNKRYIIIDSTALKSEKGRYVVLHELYHLKDDVLVNGSDKFYSDNNISIIDTTLNKHRIYNKIENLIKMYSGDEVNDNDFDRKYKHHMKVAIYEYVTTNTSYIISNPEVYVRINILRKYLLDNKIIKTFDENLTNAHFIYLLSPNRVLIKNPNQFFELLFLMKMDIGKDFIDVWCLDEINTIP